MRMVTVLAAPALLLLAGSASAQTCQAMLNALADAGATGSAPSIAAPANAGAAETGATGEAGGESGTQPTDTPEGLATSAMPGADASVENDVEEPDGAAEPATEAAQAEEAVEAVSPAAAEDDSAARAKLLQAQAQTALDAGDEQACLAKAREAAALAGQ